MQTEERHKDFERNLQDSIKSVNEDYYYLLNLALLNSLEHRKENRDEQKFLRKELTRVEKFLSKGSDKTMLYKELILDIMKDELKVFDSSETFYAALLNDLKYFNEQNKVGVFKLTNSLASYIAKVFFDYRNYLKDLTAETSPVMSEPFTPSPLSEVDNDSSVFNGLLLHESGIVDLLVEKTGQKRTSSKIAEFFGILTGRNPRTITKNIDLASQTFKKGSAAHNNVRSLDNLKQVRYILGVAGYKANALSELDEEIKMLELKQKE